MWLGACWKVERWPNLGLDFSRSLWAGLATEPSCGCSSSSVSASMNLLTEASWNVNMLGSKFSGLLLGVLLLAVV